MPALSLLWLGFVVTITALGVVFACGGTLSSQFRALRASFKVACSSTMPSESYSCVM